MEGSELRKLIRSKIETGTSHQQVYDELQGGGNMPDEKLADLIRSVPSLERRSRYRTEHVILLGLLVLAIAWKAGLEIPVAARNGLVHVLYHSIWCMAFVLVLIGVIKYWRRAHTWAGLLGMMSLFRSTADGVSTDQGFDQLVVMLLLFALAVLGFYLQRKLTPAYITVKEPYVNSEGQDRLRQVVRFGD
ncbi:MAG: hypothetical protein KF843_08045 [Flavobacteriales bacterium]|nr:hypothetical protein [Flavobacteriales bacterium]